jgi:hypothetical protein
MAITSFPAGESLFAGDIVHLSSSGFLHKGNGLVLEQASVIGVSLDTSSASSLTRVITDSIYSAYTSLTPGETRYLALSASGSLVTYATWQSQFDTLPISGAYLTSVGRAVSITALDVEVGKPTYVTK